jgi:hypothetical protein
VKREPGVWGYNWGPDPQGWGLDAGLKTMRNSYKEVKTGWSNSRQHNQGWSSLAEYSKEVYGSKSVVLQMMIWRAYGTTRTARVDTVVLVASTEICRMIRP